jgi:hypothetical protein
VNFSPSREASGMKTLRIEFISAPIIKFAILIIALLGCLLLGGCSSTGGLRIYGGAPPLPPDEYQDPQASNRS